MPALYPYRLFVSHAWHRSEGYIRILKFLNDHPYFIYHNYSVPETDPISARSIEVLKQKIRQQIAPTQIVVILAGMYVNHSGWIQFEIDTARAMQKPILGVVPWGAHRTPTAVEQAANEMVNWQASSIVSAIRRLVP